jgi:hypothetical protein
LSELAQNKYPGKKDQEADRLIPTASSGALRSVVTPDWHLVEHEVKGMQIYDWKRDQSESKDVIDTPEGARAALALASTLPRRHPDESRH